MGRTRLIWVLVLSGFYYWNVRGSQLYALQIPRSNLDFASLSIESAQGSNLAVGKQERLRVLGKTADGRRFAYPGRIKWTASNDLVEITEAGFVTGLREGRTELTATAVDEPGLEANVAIDVVKEPVLIYFQAPRSWKQARIWYWYLDGEANANGINQNGQASNAVLSVGQGNFPGPAMQALADQPGWYFIALPRFDDRLAYPQSNLKSQPIRMVFSNPDNGEKTRDFLHADGCFLAYNRNLSPGVIDGRWDSPRNCPAYPKKLRPIAEPRGGPVWGEKTYLNLKVQGARQPLTRYTFDGKAASASKGQIFSGQALTLQGEFNAGSLAELCVYTEDQSRRSDECFQFYKLAADEAQNFRQLGVSYSQASSTFSIWSPDRKSVELWLDGRTIPMGYIGELINKPGVWAVTVPGDFALKPYQFILDDVAVRDPYATMVKPGTDECIVLDPSRIQPEGGWAPLPPLQKREDAVIYELSVRDFTFSPTSGVAPAKRGKYLGLVEAGAFLNKGQSGADQSIKTGIEHLKELGVTHVQLMPVFDYASCSAKDVLDGPDCYNWGYDPENFNVPEERYASDPLDYVQRVREFQTMVNELHKAGIRVIMDVVYNHTWVRPFREADEGEKYLGDISGKYFLFDQQGFGYQLTGTGNTIDPKDPAVYQYIQDSLEYWVRTYNIDGFRFDLAGVFDYREITGWMSHLDEKFPGKQLLNYGEPYTALPDPDSQHFRLDRISSMSKAGKPAEFGGFNFIYREAIKGSNDNGYGGGFVFNEITDPSTLINGLRGSLGSGEVKQAAFTNDPVQTINYVSSHDNLNLFDKINAWAALQGAPVSLEYKKRIQIFANAVILLSQGLPFIHSGEEMLRSKNGLINTYQAGDGINKIDWNRKKQFKDVHDAYAQLIQTRRRFAGLRLATQAAIERAVQIQDLGAGLFEVKIAREGEDSPELLILLNSGTDRSYQLPAGEWTLAIEKGRASVERKISGRVAAEGTAATVLFR